jgi:hypothetical protein
VGEQVADRFTISSVSSVASLMSSMKSISDKPKESLSFVTVGYWRQLKWLLWRSYVSGARSPLRTSKLAFRLFLMAVIFGAAFFQLDSSRDDYVQNLTAVCYVIGMSLMISNMSIVAVTTINERTLLIRDTQRGIYSIGAYYAVKVISDSIFVIIVSTLYTIIIMLLVNMKEFTLMMLVVSMEGLAACATVSLMVALSSSILILNQFTGYYINLRSIPIYFRWVQYFSVYYYAYPSMLILQWRDVTSVLQPCQFLGIPNNNTLSTPSTICYVSGIDILNEYGIDQGDLYFNLVMLLALILGFHIISFIITFIRIRRTL